MNKHILVDCDGVLLDTLEAVGPYLESIGLNVPAHEKATMYADEYSCFKNKQEAFECFAGWQKHSSFSQIPPLKGSVNALKKLKNLGFEISIITAAGHLDIAKKHRQQNLDTAFGKDFFEDVIFVDWTESKNNALMKFKPAFFVEDLALNAINALATHHRPILIRNNQNRTHIQKNQEKLDGVTIVESWSEIFDIVTNNK